MKDSDITLQWSWNILLLSWMLAIAGLLANQAWFMIAALFASIISLIMTFVSFRMHRLERLDDVFEEAITKYIVAKIKSRKEAEPDDEKKEVENA